MKRETIGNLGFYALLPSYGFLFAGCERCFAVSLVILSGYALWIVYVPSRSHPRLSMIDGEGPPPTKPMLLSGNTQAERARFRPANFGDLPPDEQWAIHKRRDILDWRSR